MPLQSLWCILGGKLLEQTVTHSSTSLLLRDTSICTRGRSNLFVYNSSSVVIIRSLICKCCVLLTWTHVVVNWTQTTSDLPPNISERRPHKARGCGHQGNGLFGALSHVRRTALWMNPVFRKSLVMTSSFWVKKHHVGVASTAYTDMSWWLMRPLLALWCNGFGVRADFAAWNQTRMKRLITVAFHSRHFCVIYKKKKTNPHEEKKINKWELLSNRDSGEERTVVLFVDPSDNRTSVFQTHESVSLASSG